MSVELLRAADTGVETDYVARAGELLPLIAETSAAVETGRRLDERVVAALHDAGLFRIMMPRWLDGGEAPPSEYVQVIETIARADASTAWCLSQMNVCSLSSVYLDRDVAREVFGGKGAALAWGSTPDARAVRVAGGSGSPENGSSAAGAITRPGSAAISRSLSRTTRRFRTRTALRSNARCCSRKRRRGSPMSGMCWACAAPAATLHARKSFHPGTAHDHLAVSLARRGAAEAAGAVPVRRQQPLWSGFAVRRARQRQGHARRIHRTLEAQGAALGQEPASPTT